MFGAIVLIVLDQRECLPDQDSILIWRPRHIVQLQGGHPVVTIDHDGDHAPRATVLSREARDAGCSARPR